MYRKELGQGWPCGGEEGPGQAALGKLGNMENGADAIMQLYYFGIFLGLPKK